jgi:hypothetical protein
VKGRSRAEPSLPTVPLTPKTVLEEVAATVIAVALVPGDEIDP